MAVFLHGNLKSVIVYFMSDLLLITERVDKDDSSFEFRGV